MTTPRLRRATAVHRRPALALLLVASLSLVRRGAARAAAPGGRWPPRVRARQVARLNPAWRRGSEGGSSSRRSLLRARGSPRPGIAAGRAAARRAAAQPPRRGAYGLRRSLGSLRTAVVASARADASHCARSTRWSMPTSFRCVAAPPAAGERVQRASPRDVTWQPLLVLRVSERQSNSLCSPRALTAPLRAAVRRRLAARWRRALPAAGRCACAGAEPRRPRARARAAGDRRQQRLA